MESQEPILNVVVLDKFIESISDMGCFLLRSNAIKQVVVLATKVVKHGREEGRVGKDLHGSPSEITGLYIFIDRKSVV